MTDLPLQWVTPSVSATEPLADPVWITARVSSLEKQFRYQPRETEDEYRMRMADWRRHLASYPQAAIEKASDKWLATMAERPTISEFTALVRRLISYPSKTSKPALVVDNDPAPEMVTPEQMREIAAEVGGIAASVFLRAPAGPIGIIIGHASEVFGVSHADILSRRRSDGLCRARFAVMLLARRHTGKSYPEIGKALDGRDHATVMHGCSRAEGMLEEDREFAALVADIERRLRA